MVMSTAPTMRTMIIMTTPTMLGEVVVKFQFWFFKLTAYYRLKVTDSTIKPWCCPLDTADTSHCNAQYISVK